jgi:hypothetical protein
MAATALSLPAQTDRLEVPEQTLPDGVSGRAYSAPLRAEGGATPHTWQVEAGALPSGLRLNPASGEIFGVPTAPGIWEPSIAVRDSERPPHTASRRLRIRVALPLTLETRSLPKLLSSSSYKIPLQATGGFSPYHFEIAAGNLPAGLSLESRTGVISGQPTELGPFTITLRVSDSSNPAQAVERQFAQNVVGPLMVDWVEPPEVRDHGIYGSLRVTNSTEEDVDLTVLIVAVNEYGKAFALGYQHFILSKETDSQEIPFGFSMPNGTYMVRADAVGEVAASNTIRRGYREVRILRVGD